MAFPQFPKELESLKVNKKVLLHHTHHVWHLMRKNSGLYPSSRSGVLFVALILGHYTIDCLHGCLGYRVLLLNVPSLSMSYLLCSVIL